MHISAFVQISFIRFPINHIFIFAYRLFYKFNNENYGRERVHLNPGISAELSLN